MIDLTHPFQQMIAHLSMLQIQCSGADIGDHLLHQANLSALGIERVDVAWVTPHVFRKAVATLIKEEVDTKSAAAQLGHASEEVTETYYIANPTQAPDVSDILQRLST